MNASHVVILLVLVCNVIAESGSGAISEMGEDDEDYVISNDGSSSREEAVHKKSLQSGDGEFSLDKDMGGFSSSGIEPSLTVNAFNNNNNNNNKNQHPAPLLTKSTFSPWSEKTDKNGPKHMKEHKNIPTVKAIKKPVISLSPTIHPRLDVKAWKKKIKPKYSYLKKIRINLKTLPYDNLSKTDNTSKHKDKGKRDEYRRGPYNTAKNSHIEFAHVNKVIDEMEKLKKSKSDEEMARKIRKGARQVMSSIAKKIVSKTTQTLAPHLRNFFQSNLKTDHENEAALYPFFIKKKHQKKKNNSLQNNAQVNQTKQSAVVNSLKIDPKMLETETKQRDKTARQEDSKKDVNIPVNNKQFSSIKRIAENSIHGNVSKHGIVNRNVKRRERQNHPGQNEDSENQSHVIGKQRSNEKNGHMIVVKVIRKTPAKLKTKEITSTKKYKLMNKRTELNTTPTPTSSIMFKKSRYNSAYKVHQYVQGVLTSSDEVHKLQDKVNRLESEMTVLQTAFAGLVHRVNRMELSFQEVSNVTQSEVIYGTTQAPTATSPSHYLGSTQQPTPKVLFTSNQLPFSTQYNDRIQPTQHSSSTPQSINNQRLVPGTPRENSLEAHRELAGMVHPSIKPTSFMIQQLQIEELPTKQHLAFSKTSPFPVPQYFNQQLQLEPEPLPTKQHRTSSKSPAFPTASSFIQQFQMNKLPSRQHLSTPTPSAIPQHFYWKVTPDPTVPDSFHKEPLPKEELKDRKHNMHQIIVPLETLYKMHAQEGTQLTDNSYSESRDFDEGNAFSAPSNTIFTDKTMKVQSPVNQHHPYHGMDDHDSQASVRPVVNIIVPNSRAASILEKEMCWIPCKNGGKCNGRNTCQCPFPFQGNQCERFSLYDFINAKANKGSEGSIKKNSMPRKQFQQMSLKDLIQLGAKIRWTYD